MKDQELYDLCRRLYEKTGWEDVRDFYHENDTFDAETQTFKRNGIFSIVEHKRADYNTPIYTSDYLLEKLPSDKMIALVKDVIHHDENGKEWVSNVYAAHDFSDKTHQRADTPLKALLKLTIALHEAGEL